MPVGAIVSGPLSNGLNITQACITQTERSEEEKVWGMVHRQGMTLISPGTTHHGSGSCAGHVSTAQEVLLVPGRDVSPAGPRWVGMARRWSSEVLGAPTGHTRAGGAQRAAAWPPLFFKLEKTSFKNNVLKLTNDRHYQEKKKKEKRKEPIMF